MGKKGEILMEGRFKEIEFKVCDFKSCTFVFIDIRTGHTLNIRRLNWNRD